MTPNRALGNIHRTKRDIEKMVRLAGWLRAHGFPEAADDIEQADALLTRAYNRTREEIVRRDGRK